MSTAWYAPNQQAVRADGSGPAEEGTGGTPGVESTADKPYYDMNKAELAAVAESRGMDTEGMTKDEIREAIEGAET